MDKLGSSSLDDQKSVIYPITCLLPDYSFILLGDREFCSKHLATWLLEIGWGYCLRLRKSTYVRLKNDELVPLQQLASRPGVSIFLQGVNISTTAHKFPLRGCLKRGYKSSQDYENLSLKKKVRQKIMRAARKSYMRDITDEQWELLKGFIPAAKPGGRPRKVDSREIINAIFYILSAGCPWRMLPHDFPVWQTVYDYFRNWRIAQIWEPINRQFNQWVRVSGGKEATPSMAITDSQRRG